MKEAAKPKYDTTFFERYARISLIDLVDRRFSGLKNCDRPDLQDAQLGIGIEVTRAIREDKDVAHALINEMVGRPVMEVSEDDWIDMTRNGYGYGINDRLIGQKEYEYWAAAMPLQRIIENKVRKVSGGFYGDFQIFGLYIFLKEKLSAETVRSTLQYTSKLQKNNGLKYDFIYLSQIREMFVCDMKELNFSMIDINKEQCREFYREAIR
ncbi:MAG: hypothetical protein LBE91_01170 [Tannerella sp.]|jgi:hypothetical protein|nr:hypothetical protein [Tannerella sp.]